MGVHRNSGVNMVLQRKPQFFRLAHAIQMFVYTSRFYAQQAGLDHANDVMKVNTFRDHMAHVVADLIANGTIMQANVICDGSMWGLSKRGMVIPCAKFQVVIDPIVNFEFVVDFERGPEECLFDPNDMEDPEIPINPFHVEFKEP